MRGFCVLMCVLFPALAQAHVANVASFELHQDQGVWLLDVHTSTAGLHKVLSLRDAPTDPDGYREHAVRVIRDGVRITLDGEAVTLGEGGIRLAAHQTDVRFVLEGVSSEAPEGVRVVVDALSEQAGQQNIFRWLGEGHLVLSERNGFSGVLRREAEDVVMAEHEKPTFWGLYGVLGFAVVLLAWSGRGLIGSRSRAGAVAGCGPRS